MGIMKAVKASILAPSILALGLAGACAAQAEIAVIVHPQNPAASMTAAQAADIYLGKSTGLTPVELPESSAVRGQFYSSVLGRDVAQVKAVWARLIFSGKATPPKELSSSADVKKAVAADPKAIGYIEKSAVDSSVKVVLTSP